MACISSNFLFFKIFFLLFYLHVCPSEPFIMYMLVCLIVSHSFLRFCLCIFILFSPCSSKYVISIDLSLRSLMLSSAFSNLLSKPSIEHFISVIILFTYRISIYFLFNLHLFIDILYLVRHCSGFVLFVCLVLLAYLKQLT